MARSNAGLVDVGARNTDTGSRLVSASPGDTWVTLRCWRLFIETSLALVDVLDTELQEAAGIPQRWYDVLVHLEESPDGIAMTELADQILYSKSGFTRLIDRMEEAGLVSRVRPQDDRRSILVTITDQGTQTIEQARRHHRDGIE